MWSMELSPYGFFLLAGGEGPETSMLDKHIVQKIANKTEEKYEKIQTLIRCKLSFLILRLVLLWKLSEIVVP